MIEVVFSDSACGSLKIAQHFGEGLIGDATGVCIIHEDGSKPSRKELRRAKQQAILREQKQRESGKPLGGKAQDVYGLSLALSVGSIAPDPLGVEREKLLARLLATFPQGKRAARELLQNGMQNVRSVLRHSGQGEDIRIWYSDQPDERCGMCWLLAQLDQLRPHGKVFLVKLPCWESQKAGVVVHRHSWAEVEPGEWAAYLGLQRQAPDSLCTAMAQEWQMLQQENAPLRAVINGYLHSVPEDFYDPFIRREIAQQPTEFQQAVVIGKVLGNYQFGISDAWVALRMQQMLQSGMLEAITQPPEEGPVYHRILRKCSSFC